MLFILPIRQAQEGARYPITDAEHALFSPWQRGGEHGSGCALWTEKIPSMEYH
jgi:hypothetical protein